MHLMDEARLIQMSSKEYSGFLAANEVVDYGAQAEMVKRVGNKLALATEKYLKEHNGSNRVKGFDWEFNLVRSEQMNAWCMPGGKICFYTGILDMTQDETGLAVVMGHEIAHAIARHGNERMSKGSMLNVGGEVLNVALSGNSDITRGLWLYAYGVSANVGVMLTYSRKHELEADMMGLVFMQLAGYDAKKAVDFWKRMAEKGGDVPEFLSTHPNDEKRAQKISEFLNSDTFLQHTH